MRVRIFAIILPCLSITASAAKADSSFDTKPALDLGVATGAAGMGAALSLLRMATREVPAECVRGPCGSSRSDGARPYNATWNALSYGTVSLAIAGGFAPSSARAVSGEYGASGLGGASTMMAQAIGVTYAFTEIVKTVAPRPRPFLAWPPAGDDTSARSSPDAVASYLSGHTSFAFAAASVGTFDACRARGPLGCMGPAIGLHALAMATAAGRVLAGKHHVSDVIAGAGIGAAVGTAVSMLHAPVGREQGVDGGRAIAASQGMMLSMMFLW